MIKCLFLAHLLFYFSTEWLAINDYLLKSLSYKVVLGIIFTMSYWIFSFSSKITNKRKKCLTKSKISKLMNQSESELKEIRAIFNDFENYHTLK